LLCDFASIEPCNLLLRNALYGCIDLLIMEICRMSRLTSRTSLTLRQNDGLILERRANTQGRRPSRSISHDPVENEQIRAEVAQYIAGMATELATMARAANFDVLAYFLDMARMEANVRVEEQERTSA
jgi:hypothetical protein